MAEFFNYKGFPLVRNGNTIYYGNMSDEFVAMLQIKSSHKVKDIEVADKVMIALSKTDIHADGADMIVKTSLKQGLYEALDLANVWLSKRVEA